MNKTFLWCNGYANCDDGCDEDPVSCKDCKLPAALNQTRPGLTKCEDSLICITEDWLCDGFAQCIDMSDELSPQCPNLCDRTFDPEDAFLCEDRTTCIPTNSTCNGLNNCPDGSDESFELCKDAPQNGTFR